MPCWTDKPEYEPAPPVDENAWYAHDCKCHGQPMVYRSGNWKCQVKYRATQKRYDLSEKRKAAWKRQYQRPSRKAALARRAYISGKSIYFDTDDQHRRAKALIVRMRDELKQRQQGRAKSEAAATDAVPAKARPRKN